MKILKKLSTTSAGSAVVTRETGRYFHVRKGAMQKVGLVAIGTLLTSAFSTPALGLTLDGAANFQNYSFPSGQGASIGTASYLDGLNINTGKEGFDNFFTSTDGNFGRLGTTATSTTSGATQGTFIRISNPFQFSASGSQTVSYKYAIDGTPGSLANTGIGNTYGDTELRVYLATYNQQSNTINSITGGNTHRPVVQTANASQSTNASFTINPNTGTNYVVAFELFEDSLLTSADDVGAGFDNVVVSNATAVPFEFSPSMGILALGAWGAFSHLKGKLKNRKPLKVGSLTTNDGQA